MILQTAVGGRVIIVVKRVIRQSVVLQPNAKNHVLFVGVLIIILNSVQRFVVEIATIIMCPLCDNFILLISSQLLNLISGKFGLLFHFFD